MRIAATLLMLATLFLPVPAGAEISLFSMKNGLIQFALEKISSPGSFEVTAGAVEEPGDGVTSLVEVKIADDKGVWLTLERVNFSWSASALLSGELAITRLELIGLSVLRAPSDTAQPPELKPVEPSGRGLFDWPRSPIDLSIDGVRLERVSIAEGVLPQAIAFDAQGRAFDKGDLQELVLSLKRTDAVAGSIALTMRRDFAANTVTLDLTAAEAPGGMVATAAGFPGDAPARLTLKAGGPPEDWKLIFDAGVERVFDADGTATLAYADRLSVDADFSVTPGPQLGETARTVLGERATLKAQLTEGDGGVFDIRSASLTSPALTLTASGAFASGAGDSDVAVSLVALPPLAALAPGVTFERFAFDGRVTGPQGALAAAGSMQLTALATAAADAGLLRLDGRVTQTADGATFDVTGTGEGLRIDKLGPEVIGAATLGAQGALAGDMLTLAAASLNAQALRAGASGSYDLAASSGDLAVTLEAPDIAPVAAAYGTAAKGAVTASAQVSLAGGETRARIDAGVTGFAADRVTARRLTLQGTVANGAGGTDFDLTGGTQDLVLDKIPADLTRDTAFKAMGNLRGGTLTLGALTLDAALLQAGASGSVDLDAGTLALDYSLDTADLAPVARAYGAEAGGALRAAGTAEGSLDTPRIAGTVSMTGARHAGRSYGALELSHDIAAAQPLTGSASVAMTGGDLGDGEAAANFRLDGAQLTLDGLKARLLGAALSGDAVADLDTSLVEGKLDLSVPDLAPAGRFAGMDLSGKATGKAVLTAAEGRQNLDADLALTGFATGGASLAAARLRLKAADLLGAPALDASLTADRIAAGKLELATATARATGPLSAIDFSAEAGGTLGRDPLTASLAGRADASGPVAMVTLARAQVTAGTDSISLRQPLRLRAGDGAVIAEGLDLALPEGGSLTGDAAQRPGGFTGDLTLARLPLTVLERWAGAPVTAGLLDLKAAFDTRAGSARADVSARARGIGFEKTRSARGALDLDLDANWNGARLEARSELRGDFGDPLRAHLAVPLRPGADGVPQVPKRGALDGSVAWAGDIGDLWALVPAVGHIMDGQADIDLRLDGTIEAPQVSGRASLTGGEYQNLDAGTILTGLTVATDIAGDGTVTMTLDADDGSTGTVAARMALRLDGPASIDLTTKIDQAVLVRRDDVTAQVSGDIALAGPLKALALTGALTIDRAEVRLIAATPPSVVELDGIRIKGAPEPEEKKDDGSRIALDLTVTAPKDIFVRGRGLDSEWKMDLALTGDAAQPVVTGAIEKVRGQLDLLGRPFDLARGRVAFDGGAAIDPLIDVSLEREANGITGGIVVEGRASAPEVRFASVPELPEDEVLPRLLFGQSRQSLSGPEAIQLATGVATLMSGKAGPLDFAREAVGVDVLRIEGETVEDSSLTVGRNISEGVFLGARQGLQGQGTTVTVEVDVFDGVKVDSEISQQGGSTVGITWRKDF